MSTDPAPQASERLLAALAETQARRQLFPSGHAEATALLVAVSGGLDSVCLLHALQQLAAAWRLTLYVGHVDHRLRPTSGMDARFVADLAAAWQLPFHLVELDPARLQAAPGGLEAAARHARYAALCRMAAAVAPTGQAPLIALAHHADDQAETILLHLVQGAGLHGLAGMRPVAPLAPALAAAGGVQGPIQLVRPFLGVRRAELLAYARAHHLTWREDATNQELHPVRNRLRHQLLPALEAINPGLVGTLGRNAGLLAEEADRLDALDQATLAGLLAGAPDPVRVVLELEGFCALPRAAQRGVLRQALLYLDADLRAIGYAHLDELAAQAGRLHQSSGPHPLPAGLAWSVVGKATAPARLSLHRLELLPVLPDHPWLDTAWRRAVGMTPLPEEGELEAGDWQLSVQTIRPAALPEGWRNNPDGWRAFLDAETLGTVALTAPFPGATIAPLGMGGHHKTLGDLFTDGRIPVPLRAGWPLIADRARRQVSWVCGLRIAHTAAVTATTRRVAVLAWKRR